MDKWTKDYCPSCKKEMRKWITDQERILKDGIYVPIPNTGKCVSMCITPDCEQKGVVKRAIQNHNSFKISVSMEI